VTQSPLIHPTTTTTARTTNTTPEMGVDHFATSFFNLFIIYDLFYFKSPLNVSLVGVCVLVRGER
jgi:hypothetical protein